jgi:hypothetical protein
VDDDAPEDFDRHCQRKYEAPHATFDSVLRMARNGQCSPDLHAGKLRKPILEYVKLTCFRKLFAGGG